MTLNRSALLRDVAQTIIASGYAVPLKRRHVRRGAQIAELARDSWIECGTHSATYRVLIDDVMIRYSASRGTAREMVRRAREIRKNNGRV